MAKRRVRVNIVKNESEYFLQGSIDKVIEMLVNIKKEYKDCEDIQIDLDSKEDPYEDYSRTVVNISGYRPENAEERKARLARARQERKYQKEVLEAKEAHELEEYERLKNKFENK